MTESKSNFQRCRASPDGGTMRSCSLRRPPASPLPNPNLPGIPSRAMALRSASLSRYGGLTSGVQKMVPQTAIAKPGGQRSARRIHHAYPICGREASHHGVPAMQIVSEQRLPCFDFRGDLTQHSANRTRPPTQQKASACENLVQDEAGCRFYL